MKKINIEDYKNHKYGRLTILKEGTSVKYGKTIMRKVVCLCDCGNTKEIDFNSIKRGKSTSCGCYNKEQTKKNHTKHGKAMLSTGIKHPDYNIWVKLKQRCYNPKNKSYKYYGQKGIKVCDRWLHSFENFIEDLGWRPNQDYSLERIDYNKDYSPENCKWILKSEQPKNSRRVKLIKYNNQEYCLTDLCKLLHLSYSTMRHRVYVLNIPFDQAIKYPKYYKIKKKSNLRIGLAFFGQIGMFKELKKRKDMTDADYADVISKSYFLKE